jgi:DNA polymerase-3 subunit alpha
MAGPGFIHLHVHSAYSLLEGALPLSKLLDLAKADKQPALGIADTNNLFGALEFSEKAAGKGIQPLIGVELAVDFSAMEDSQDRMQERGHDRGRFGKGGLVLLATSENGFANLSSLVSRAHLEGENGRAAAKLGWMHQEALDGIICLSGGPEGAIDPWFANNADAIALARLDRLRELFGDRLYIELQRHGRPQETLNEAKLIDYAYARGVPLVATNEPFFPAPIDHEAHDALLAIAAHRAMVSDRQPPQAHQPALFQEPRGDGRSSSPICPRRWTTRSRSRNCIGYRAEDSATRSCRPSPPPTARSAEEAVTRRGAGPGSYVRGPVLRNRHGVVGVDSRLDRRGSIANGWNSSSASSSDEVPGLLPDRCRLHPMGQAQGIPVGPGRGSGAGSLVAYAPPSPISIRCASNLLFERFLNPERVSMPDFDIDFCQDRREEVIRYVQQKYGTRAGRADHHLRYAAGARRAARRWPRAADALWPGRQVSARWCRPIRPTRGRSSDRMRSRSCSRGR